MTHPQLLDAMSQPEFYPDKPDHIEVRQTHISFIFIAGNLVYKVKKAVDFGFLDFTTLQKRHFYCQEELRLNRRLAPETYRAVVEIVERPDGTLALEGDGTVVDYAVVMKRLPEERMLKNLLVEGAVPVSSMERIATTVADFHSRAQTGGAIDEAGGLDAIRANHEENFEQTAAYIGITIPEYQHSFIRSSIRAFLTAHKDLFERRVRNHRIRECHGDLHIEHICLLDPEIVIFDCIEFNERFRYEDVAAEVAFLAMDLDFNGYAEHGNTFVEAYITQSGDEEIRQLLNFYKSYYAFVRGKVIGFKTNDPTIGEDGQRAARNTATRYFDLAYSYASHLEKPALILMAGLTGTGKSALAGDLASRLGAHRLQMDALRKDLLNIPATDHHFEAFGQGIYSEEVSERVYTEALERAEESLKNGTTTIIDASYKRREERLRAQSLAKQLNVEFRVIECRCPEDVLKDRLERRLTESGELSDGRWEIYLKQKEDFDPIDELPSAEHIVITTSAPPESCVNTALLKLKNIE